MPDLLNTSLTGMLAFQRALDVTSHNIANANTPGYSRQISQFSARVGFGGSSGVVGSGVQISTIRRAYDGLQVEQLRTSQTGFARFDTLNDLASRLDRLLADPDTGLNSKLQSYFNALQDVANDPSSLPTRQALIGEAEGTAARFRALDAQFDALDSEVNNRIELAVADINRLAASIAVVNDRISLASGADNAPNDLLDERDNLVLQLAEQVSVSTSIQDDGTMSVFIGSGQPLVLNANARQLEATASEFDPTRLSVSYRATGGSVPLDATTTGGKLGGLLEYRARILDPARQSLGRSALAMAQTMNQQHAAGMDLRGNLGGELFAIADPVVLPSSSNTGTPGATVSVADLSGLEATDYVLEFDGSNYTLTRTDTNTAVAMSGTGSVADPFVADGLEIVTSGAAAGDRLLIRATADAAGSMQNLINDPQALALAAPTRSAAVLSNTGDGAISATQTVDPTDPALLNPVTIEFTSASTYSINGAGSFAYTDGAPIVVNGTEVTISGAPAVGDQFTIAANFGAAGDNSNALLLSDVQSRGILDGGSIGINENYGQLVASVGATTHQIQSSLDAQDVVLRNAQDSVLATSAVNLDEEAAKLIQYQQAYQAVAQVVSVASTLFDSLLNATRR